MRDKKKIVIGVLCALVGIMAVGYAALATRLNITGTASIDSTWKVGITNITERDIVGDATSKETPSYTATTANFSVGLIQPGDSITYDIELSNEGTLAAKVDSIDVVMDENDAITYATSGVVEGDKLGVGEKDTLSVTVAYNPEVTSQPTNTSKDITVTINYVQDLGTDSEADIPSTGTAYSVGDQITFAGSNWYVIKDSSSDDDYVTLMKEKVLTNTELGEYGATQIVTCTADDVMNEAYGCKTEGETVTNIEDAMAYYWDDTCHVYGYYGYTNDVWSGCEGHNDYEGSKVREFFDGTYINTLGSDNLKEVDGYKIRLITFEELQNDFGYVPLEDQYIAGASTPNWIYQGYNMDTADRSYWTMSVNANNGTVWFVGESNMYDGGASYPKSVRPVINLLKSSI